MSACASPARVQRLRVCIACACATPVRERGVAWQVSRLMMRGDPVPLFEALLLLLLPAGSKQRTPLLEQILVFLRSDACLLAQLAQQCVTLQVSK